MAKQINVCIVHYNTPMLTECLVDSINKFTPGCHIYIFDNSDTRPFFKQYDNVTVFDNTHGDIINFDEFLNKYPNRDRSGGAYNRHGSAKHCYTVEKCMELIQDGFVLMDSDILLKSDFSDIIREEYAVCGCPIDQFAGLIRVSPYLCYLNVPQMKKQHITYFNEEYMHSLYFSEDGDRYDTGAWLYKEVCNSNNLFEFNHDDYIIHYSGDSWYNKRNKIEFTTDGITKREPKTTPLEWLYDNYELWGDENKENDIKLFGVTLVYNESKMIPYIMPYYERMNFDKLIVYDNYSTDNTVELLKKYSFVEIRYFKTDGMDNLIQAKLKNDTCMEFVNIKNAWMYVSDFDEVLYYDGNFKKYLQNAYNYGYTHLNQQMFQPLSQKFPDISVYNLAHRGIKYGTFWDYTYGMKMTLFRLDWCTNITYSPGAHFVSLMIKFPPKSLNNKKLKSLHLKYIDYDYLFERTKIAASRRSKSDIDLKYGREYEELKHENSFKEKWEKLLKSKSSVCDYLNDITHGEQSTSSIRFFMEQQPVNETPNKQSLKRSSLVKKEHVKINNLTRPQRTMLSGNRFSRKRV